MNERPTPETDAQAMAIYANVSPTNNQRFVAMTKWAEKLEQQRDGVALQMDAQREAIKAAVSLLYECVEQLDRMTHEDRKPIKKAAAALIKLQPFINA